MTHENSLPPNLYDLSIPTADFIPGYFDIPPHKSFIDNPPKDEAQNVAANIDEVTARVTKSKQVAPDAPAARSVSWRVLVALVVPPACVLLVAWLYWQGWRVAIP